MTAALTMIAVFIVIGIGVIFLQGAVVGYAYGRRRPGLDARGSRFLLFRWADWWYRLGAARSGHKAATRTAPAVPESEGVA